MVSTRRNQLWENMLKAADTFTDAFIPQFDPKSLFHYTSAAGLKSILESQKLRFTHYAYLNDYTELQYICSVVKECLDDLKSETPELYKLYRADHEESFDKKLSRLISSMDVYVASFSLVCDKLNMWTYYTKDESAEGYCIEFESFYFSRRMQELNEEISLRPCFVIYDKAKQKSVVSSCLKIMEGSITSVDELTPEQKGKMHEAFFNMLRFYAPAFKHEAFADEQECRIICTSPSPDFVLTRTKKGHIVPYLELSYDRDKVKSITCSPTLYQCPVEIGLHALLSANGLPSCEIKRSGIPFRSN